ncbi:ATP-binding protein [Cupriavidus sp. IDO]|uniref:ATP-binding protein n=1 Tax=Cupriavidus sp. IDO TaxID=1539142 RepID=UPI0005791EE3|nr:ATP-binding protein [Cupriavidus sp. IDO]KWR76396.1 ATPase [Cupriavidus sp. IDO]
MSRTEVAWRAWPHTLFARLMLILLIGLALAQGLSFGLVMLERTTVADRTMLGNLELDVASSVAMLDMLPADKRAAWLDRLQRNNYSYRLDAGTPGDPPRSPLSRRAVDTITLALQDRYAVTANDVPGNRERFQVHLRLHDGNPLTIDVRPKPNVLSSWLPVLLCAQLALLAVCAWIAVRLVTRPLKQLAVAAENLGPDLKADRIPERGPAEVAHAATAFNAMQARIAGYLAERVQILAAISHDLQTPITRMRLRVDLMEPSETQDKLFSDLRAMEHLVREGIAYASTLHGSAEALARVDPDALLDSLAGDYLDSGNAIAVEGKAGAAILTRPQALRRILTNLIDNAIKFGGEVDVAVSRQADGHLAIAVRDRGPGIPEAELERVMQPFYRLETSRNRGTGGTGLGLAIAQQLSQALGGTLTLSNRKEGGLQAILTLPA